jgi:hypothetical protein
MQCESVLHRLCMKCDRMCSIISQITFSISKILVVECEKKELRIVKCLHENLIRSFSKMMQFLFHNQLFFLIVFPECRYCYFTLIFTTCSFTLK